MVLTFKEQIPFIRQQTFQGLNILSPARKILGG